MWHVNKHITHNSIISLATRAPMLSVALCMGAGILLADAGMASCPMWLLCLSVAIGTTLMSVAATCRKISLISLPAFIITFVGFGMLYCIVQQPTDPFSGVAPRQKVEMIAHVVDLPKATAKGNKVMVVVDSVAHAPSRGKIMLYIKGDTIQRAMTYGDRLCFSAVPQQPLVGEEWQKTNYRKQLRHRGALWQCFVDEGEVLRMPDRDNFMLKRFARQCQERLVFRLRSCGLDPNNQALAEALVLGWRDDIQEEARAQFRDAGVAHLLCVSGLHVGLFAALVSGCLLLLGRGRWQRVVRGVISIVAIWIYVIITGMAPSTMRAGLMFSLMQVSTMMERRSISVNNLATSAVVLLLINPMVLYDVGFQLSYAALLGIMLWHEPLYRLILGQPSSSWVWWPFRKVWSWICLSTSAQLATLPIVLFYFHQFPVYFLVANLLVVPFAGLLLAAVALMMLTGGWLTPVVGALMSWTTGVTSWVASLPCAVIDNIYFDLPMVVFLVMLLLAFTSMLSSRRKIVLWFVALWGIVLIVYAVGVDRRALGQHKVVVYRSSGDVAVECIVGRQSYLVCDAAVAADPGRLGSRREELLNLCRIKSWHVLDVSETYADSMIVLKNRCIFFDNSKVLIIDSSNSAVFRYNSDVDTLDFPHFDMVVVERHQWVDSSRIALMSPDTVYYLRRRTTSK